jgi:hypothetical protein
MLFDIGRLNEKLNEFKFGSYRCYTYPFFVWNSSASSWKTFKYFTLCRILIELRWSHRSAMWPTARFWTTFKVNVTIHFTIQRNIQYVTIYIQQVPETCRDLVIKPRYYRCILLDIRIQIYNTMHGTMNLKNELDVIKIVYLSLCKVPLFVPLLIKLEISPHVF